MWNVFTDTLQSKKRTCTPNTINQFLPEVGPHPLHCIWLTWVQWPPPSRPRNSFQTTASERRCREMASWEKDVPQTGSNKENMRGREELESMWWYCAQSEGQSGGECAVRGVRERERQRTTPLLKGLTWRKKSGNTFSHSCAAAHPNTNQTTHDLRYGWASGIQTRTNKYSTHTRMLTAVLKIKTNQCLTLQILRVRKEESGRMEREGEEWEKGKGRGD